MARDERGEPRDVRALRVEILAAIFAAGLVVGGAGAFGLDVSTTTRGRLGSVLLLVAGAGALLYGLFASWWTWSRFYRRR